MTRDKIVARISEIEGIRDAGGLWNPSELSQLKEELRWGEREVAVTIEDVSVEPRTLFVTKEDVSAEPRTITVAVE